MIQLKLKKWDLNIVVLEKNVSNSRRIDGYVKTKNN